MVNPRGSIWFFNRLKTPQNFITVTPGSSGLIGNRSEPPAGVIREAQAFAQAALDLNQPVAVVVRRGLHQPVQIPYFSQKAINVIQLNRHVCSCETPAACNLFQRFEYTRTRLITAAVP